MGNFCTYCIHLQVDLAEKKRVCSIFGIDLPENLEQPQICVRLDRKVSSPDDYCYDCLEFLQDYDTRQYFCDVYSVWQDSPPLRTEECKLQERKRYRKYRKAKEEA